MLNEAERKKEVSIVNVSAPIMDVFQLTQIHKMFEITIRP